MTNQNTVLYLNNFKGKILAGGERHLLLLARAAREAGYEVIIGAHPGSGLSRAAADEGFGLEELDLSLLRAPANIRGLRRIISERRIGIVHTHGFFPNNLGRWVGRGVGRGVAPVLISTVHCQPDSNMPTAGRWRGRAAQAARDRIERLTARWADLIIAISADIAKRLAALGVDERKIAVIHNGIDAKAARDAAARTPETDVPGGDLIVTVGRQEAVKGTEYLIEALALLSLRHPGLGLLVVGDGPRLSSLRELAASLGLTDRVWFTGDVGNSLPYVERAKVYALASLSEGLNTTLLEAAVLGVPMVATDVGGNGEVVVNEETGLLVPPRDVSALATAIERLINNEALREKLTAAAGRRVEAKFSAERMTAQTLKQYERVLKRAGA